MNEKTDIFLLSKTKKIKGNRRLVREKVLQILYTLEMSEDSSLQMIFDHIFNRIFKFDDNFESKTDKLLKPDEIIELEADYPIEWDNDDREFGIQLMNYYLELKVLFTELTTTFSKNWEMNRIAPTDRIIIGIAVSEFIKFPEIPIKVTINEAIELSKEFSTEKSAHFINGLLDSIKKHLVDEKMINKVGRGLIE